MRPWHGMLLVVLMVAAGCAAGPAPGPPPLPAPSRTFRLADSGVYGDLYLPPAPVAHAHAVLVLGGSEGGLSGVKAAALARQGFVALVVAYFGESREPQLPATLANIPVEYFATAARLLAAQPEVDPAHVVVWGASRGSEAAALLAGDYPDLVHGAVLESPSSVANPGYPDPGKPAWSLHGKPVATVPASDFGDDDPTGDPQALLPVDRITGPIVTICGSLDLLWPSCRSSTVIAKRAAPGQVTALSYPDAGHSPVATALVVDAGLQLNRPTEGGTVEGDVAAGNDAFTHIVAVLHAA